MEFIWKSGCPKMLNHQGRKGVASKWFSCLNGEVKKWYGVAKRENQWKYGWVVWKLGYM